MGTHSTANGFSRGLNSTLGTSSNVDGTPEKKDWATMLRFIRSVSSLSLKPKKSLKISQKKNVNPIAPARTRFAPSPTGFLHLGSLRTALYNYLLARRTGGQFLLRLEDTDRKRLVQGAEENIYESLKWCGLNWDEGPNVGGEYGPYRQSDRSEIYKKYSDQLLESGKAYRCFCSKERLDGLRESAMKLQPPTTVTYDRVCSHIHPDESNRKAANNEEFTVRFKSPALYPKVEDLLHGTLDLQPQVNADDVRYDDPILVKSDGLPTYHFANVVDDHLMKITHVIRGEEWLPSTPKHRALYDAFGWDAPKFIHIPLLTSTKDKKLSKRTGDIDVMNFKNRGYLPEALVNFVALFGWSPARVAGVSLSEVLSLKKLEEQFTVSDLTKGNAKVDEKKLAFFQKEYLNQRLSNDLESAVDDALEILSPRYPNIERNTVRELINKAKHNFNFLSDITNYDYLLGGVDFGSDHVTAFLQTADRNDAITLLEKFSALESEPWEKKVESLTQDFKKKQVFETLRFALSGSIPGLQIPILIEFLGDEETTKRVNDAIKILSS